MVDRKMNLILCIQKLYFGFEIVILYLLCEGEGEVGGRSREFEIWFINFLFNLFCCCCRLWDDGVIDLVDMWIVLGFSLSVVLNVLIGDFKFGVFRM